ncbi:CMRF35-like molecule 5 [Xyrauchen texanus]|uniref:CMRF35-like molecule 5 n=1 Tax=Xyrauchen texanus TaxID=154827 RepID=UPI002241EE50|nr:CMRF35-like molecule 5 [Xyrauchen texanus]
MWKLLVFFACMITDVGSDVVGNPTSITGYREKTLDISCPYESGYERNVKYFCKGECFLDRNIIIESGSPAKDERFSLTDDTTARVFTVSITDLRTEDEGKYWCAVRRSLQTDVYSEIMLLVKTDNMITEVSTITPFSKNTPSYFSISSLNPQSSKTPHTDQSPSSTGHVVIFIIAAVLLLLLIGPLVIVFIRMKSCDLISSSAEGICPAFRKGEEIENENVTSKVLPGSPTADNDETSAADECHRPITTEPGNMADPHKDSNYINVSPPATYYLDQELDSSSRNHVYQCLTIDSGQQSVYHSINRTAD